MKTENGTVTPELRFEITKENYERAIAANSGSCIVADAIKEQYPQFTNIKVDVQTVRFSDKERGVRYTYLTPPSVSDTLLFYDQGWKEEKLPKTLRLRTALRVVPIVRSASDLKIKAEKRALRVANLEAKEQSGESLTSDEKRALARMKKPPTVRPTTQGPIQTEPVEGSDEVIVLGGSPRRKTGKYKLHQANILAGQHRHFGEKHAKPSQVFREAVEAAVKEAMEADRLERNANG